MCEVETAFNLRCPEQFKRIDIDFLDNKNWLTSTDHTKMCTQDRGVLTAFNEFILKWKRIFDRLRRHNGKARSRKNRKQKTMRNKTKENKTKNKRTQGRRRKNSVNKQ